MAAATKQDLEATLQGNSTQRQRRRKGRHNAGASRVKGQSRTAGKATQQRRPLHCEALQCTAQKAAGEGGKASPLAGSRVSGTAPFTSLSGHGLAAAVSSEPGQHSSICRNKLTTNGMKTDPRPPY